MSQGHETRFEKSIDCIHSIPLLCRCFDGVYPSIHPSTISPNLIRRNPTQASPSHNPIITHITQPEHIR